MCKWCPGIKRRFPRAKEQKGNFPVLKVMVVARLANFFNVQRRGVACGELNGSLELKFRGEQQSTIEENQHILIYYIYL